MENSARKIDEKTQKSNVIILDVEGTTTSITFVKDVLFTYLKEKAAEFLEAKWETEDVQEAVEGMRKQALEDVKNEVEGVVPIPEKESSKEEQIAGLVDNLKWLISIDNKGQFMKKLSGLVWEQGYTAGDIKGHLYEDVKPALELWRSQGKRVYVYSSGSVHAQKLLMKHSECGDISALLDGNFDTAVGHKQQAESYSNILKEIGCQAEEALFLTDVVKEAAAAREAGMNTVLLVRPGNAPLADEDLQLYCSVKSFQDLVLQPSSAKRKQNSTQEEELPPTKVAKTNEKSSNDETMEVDATEVASNGLSTKDAELSKKEDTPVEVKGIENIVKPEENSVKTLDGKPVPDEAMEPETPSEDQPKEETEAAVTEANKTDSDKDQIMETEEEKIEGQKDVSVKDEKPNGVESAPNSTEVSDKDEGVVCDKTELPAQEKVETAEKVSVGESCTDVVPEKSEESLKKDTESVIEKEEIKESEKVTSCADPPSEVMTDSTEPLVSPEIESKSAECPMEGDSNDVAKLTAESELNVMVTEMNDKLNELLGEKGVALEKECDDILSKVDVMTSKGIDSVKSMIEKAIAEKESIVEENEVLDKPVSNNEEVPHPTNDKTKEETCPIKNGDSSAIIEKNDETQTTNEEKLETATSEATSDVVTKPDVEENSQESKEVISCSEKKTNGSQEVNGKKKEEVNGQDSAKNGDAEKMDGAQNRLKGTNGTLPEEIVPSETTAEQLKLKKASEDIATEQAIEQVAET